MNRVSNRDASSRNNQNRQRNRGRNNNNNRRGPNPLQRSYESNGPDVKIRGNAMQVAEKYLTLARDAQVSGDRILAENYMQHAEHYSRIIAAAQAANQQNQQAQQNQQQQQQESQQQPAANEQLNGSGPQPGLESAASEAPAEKSQEVQKTTPDETVAAAAEPVETGQAAASEPKPVQKPERKRSRRPKAEASSVEGDAGAEVAVKPARKPRTRKPKAAEPEMAAQPDAAE